MGSAEQSAAALFAGASPRSSSSATTEFASAIPEFAEKLLTKAREAQARLVFADGADVRAISAADRLRELGLAKPTLIDDAEAFHSPGIADAAAASPWREHIDLNDPLHVAALMVSAGEADACVAGASRPTSDVIRAALYCVGLGPGADLVSSSFLLVLNDGTPVVFADCGVVPEPDAAQLASIAIASAATYSGITSDEPRVAMLSYSTHGSAAGPTIERVRQATKLVRVSAPDLAVDGEMQFDTAIDERVATIKAPGSPVAGRANVFVFPNLDAGNIAYKITERLAGALALGPLLQGTAGVIHDLSRGCTVNDIVRVAVVAACQSALERV